jgi:cellulose synthase/poly-beta-1,6-N-acetylglucosamine synthase-like glycosyltransferase
MPRTAFDLDVILAADEHGLAVRERPVSWNGGSGSLVPRGHRIEMVGDLHRLRKKYRPRTDPSRALGKLTWQGTHPIADVESTAPTTVLSAGQLAVLVVGLIALVAAFAVAPIGVVIVVNGLLIAFFATANLMKLGLIRFGHRNPCTIEIDATGPERIPDADLPVYTILLPLYHESAVLTQLVDGVACLDYPADKLDVKLLLEEDDSETRAAVAACALPPRFEVLTVPNDGPPGKPRACNHGLAHARGEYLVIYDAEDRPEADQLRKAVAAFRQSPSDLVCMQSKLNYFNRTHNVLTRLFTAEYSVLFDHVLPGLQSLGVAIPLGGTSNHFVTARLLELGGWNAFNVTEDADLGIRVYLKGWKTAILDSTTFEEANSRYGNWIRQRSRWVKGYMQTYLLHMRHPVALARRMGMKSFAIFQLFFGAGTLCLLLAPLYWLLMILWFATQAPAIEAAFPAPILIVGTVGLVLGTTAVTLCAITACYYRGHYDDVKWALLSPVYMLLMSVGAWKGFVQLLYKPRYWEKTVHGYCRLEAETTT